MIRGIIFPPNGVSFRSKRYAKTLRMLKIKHKRTKPYTPRTNGKASPSRPPRTGGGWPLDIQTSLRAWAYATPYTHSDDRRDALLPFIHTYNHHRPHFGINGKTPISRIARNNLSRHDS